MAEQTARRKQEQLVVLARDESHFEAGRPLRAAPEYIRESEEYLTSFGWKKLGTDDSGLSLWEDPKANDLSSTHVLKMPNKEHGYDTVKQLVLPPLVWQTTTEVAMQRQRERNNAGETLDQTIQRKESELESLYKQKEKRDDAVKQAVEGSSKVAVA